MSILLDTVIDCNYNKNETAVIDCNYFLLTGGINAYETRNIEKT